MSLVDLFKKSKRALQVATAESGKKFEVMCVDTTDSEVEDESNSTGDDNSSGCHMLSNSYVQNSAGDDESSRKKLDEEQDLQDENDEGQYVDAELMRY